MQPDFFKRACLCLAMKQKESKILFQFLCTGATHPTPRPPATAQVADSLGSIPVWRWLSYTLTGSSGPLQRVPTPCTVQMSSPAGTSRYQHAALGTISSPLESPQNWGAAHPQAGSDLGTGLGLGGFGAEWHTIKLCPSKDSPAPC